MTDTRRKVGVILVPGTLWVSLLRSKFGVPAALRLFPISFASAPHFPVLYPSSHLREDGLFLSGLPAGTDGVGWLQAPGTWVDG